MYRRVTAQARNLLLLYRRLEIQRLSLTSHPVNVNILLTIQQVCAGSVPAKRGICCADCKKVIQECKNPIAEGSFQWIFACNCEGNRAVTNFD